MFIFDYQVWQKKKKKILISSVHQITYVNKWSVLMIWSLESTICEWCVDTQGVLLVNTKANR